jgi:predicted O-linked N-acetylglucosamine transferase (SPINDLY family)
VFEARPAPALEHRLHALNNSARLLEQLRRYPEAEALMARSLALKAAQPDVIQHYVHIRQKQCAWPHDQGRWARSRPTSSCSAPRCWR